MNKHLKVKKSSGENSTNNGEIQSKKKSCKVNEIVTISLIFISLLVFGINLSGCKTSPKASEKKYQDSVKNPPNLIFPTQASYVGTIDIEFEWGGMRLCRLLPNRNTR